MFTIWHNIQWGVLHQSEITEGGFQPVLTFYPLLIAIYQILKINLPWNLIKEVYPVDLTLLTKKLNQPH